MPALKRISAAVLENVIPVILVIALAGWVLLQIWYAFTGFALMPHRGADGGCYQTTEYAFGYLIRTGPVPHDWCLD